MRSVYHTPCTGGTIECNENYFVQFIHLMLAQHMHGGHYMQSVLCIILHDTRDDGNSSVKDITKILKKFGHDQSHRQEIKNNA